MKTTQQLQALALQPPIIGQWFKEKDERHPQQPVQRKFHSAVIHKSSLYIYGGISHRQAEDPLAQQCSIYRYNISGKIWTKITTHFLNNNSFSYICAHSTIIYNNMMYLFGGKNYNTGAYLLGLWCLNLQSYNWKRQELKGYSPLPRQHAAMVLHQKYSIFLYGGRNGQQNLNDIHIYRIQNKLWVLVQQSSYDFKLPCRLKPALCSLGQHLYLFGGERKVVSNNQSSNILQKDFYQLRLINKPMSNKPDILIKQIITNYGPTERIASFCTVGQKYLLLWGNDNKVQGKTLNFPGIWVYSVQQINWAWLNFKKSVTEFPSLGSTINYGYDRCFFFGKYQNRSQKKSMIGEVKSSQNDDSGLLISQLDLKQLQNKLALPQIRPKIVQSVDNQCYQCIDQSKSLNKIKLNQFDIFTESIQDRIPFVYSAFGLLIDNAQIGGSKQTRVVFHHTFKQKYCLFEDNGLVHKLWTSNAEFINDFCTMRTYVEENIDNLEDQKEQEVKKPAPQENAQQLLGALNKETKQQRQQRQKQARDKQMEKQLKKRKRTAKQNFRRKKEERIEYSRNLKLGALRIGDRVTYICRYGPNNDNRRVFALQKEDTMNKDSYRIFYYVMQAGVLIDTSMDSARRYIDEQYKTFVKIANDRKEQANNFLFISKLKEIVNQKGQIQPELKDSARHSDIFCCQKKLIQTIDESLLTDSIDVSLKNYLALLYLKSEEMKISLSISENKTIQINNSEIFDKIDSLVKSDRLIDLMQALDLSNCKIIEVYYNKTNSSRARDMNRKSTNPNFLNGVVFYHRNRLVSRYKFELGETTQLFKNKLKAMQQSLLMFGFIEIKDEFAVNIFKTGFVRDDLLQQIYHRLKFVQKYAQKFGKEIKEQTKKVSQQKSQPPKKRFKNNDEAKEEIPNNSQVIDIDE